MFRRILCVVVFYKIFSKMVLKVFSAKLFIFQRKFSKKKLCYVWCLKQVLKSGFIIQKKLGIPGQLLFSVLPDGRFHGHFAVFCPRNFSNVREIKLSADWPYLKNLTDNAQNCPNFETWLFSINCKSIRKKVV